MEGEKLSLKAKERALPTSKLPMPWPGKLFLTCHDTVAQSQHLASSSAANKRDNNCQAKGDIRVQDPVRKVSMDDPELM